MLVLPAAMLGTALPKVLVKYACQEEIVHKVTSWRPGATSKPAASTATGSFLHVAAADLGQLSCSLYFMHRICSRKPIVAAPHPCTSVLTSMIDLYLWTSTETGWGRDHTSLQDVYIGFQGQHVAALRHDQCGEEARLHYSSPSMHAMVQWYEDASILVRHAD